MDHFHLLNIVRQEIHHLTRAEPVQRVTRHTQDLGKRSNDPVPSNFVSYLAKQQSTVRHTHLHTMQDDTKAVLRRRDE